MREPVFADLSNQVSSDLGIESLRNNLVVDLRFPPFNTQGILLFVLRFFFSFALDKPDGKQELTFNSKD